MRLLHVAEFPGEKSSGLIEAEGSVYLLDTVENSFRGRNPPASLKQIVCGSLDRTSIRFPGEKSSGLIEASTAQTFTLSETT